MTELSFSWIGEPTAKQRPRHTGKVVYTPAKTVKYEAMVSRIAIDAARATRWTKLEAHEPVHLSCIFSFGMPKSWSKKKREEMEQSACCKRPDIDNLVKACADGINRAEVVWHDDSQIVSLSAEKVWSESPSTIITVLKL